MFEVAFHLCEAALHLATGWQHLPSSSGAGGLGDPAITLFPSLAASCAAGGLHPLTWPPSTACSEVSGTSPVSG